MESLTGLLAYLRVLISIDTRNPPRQISDQLFAYLRTVLGQSFVFEERDLGEGCRWLLATRGQPKVLFNFHLDTVPADANWTRPVFEMTLADDKVFGLGACDTKGAAACLLEALRTNSTSSLAILFSTDEEAGSSRCIKDFLSERRDYSVVLVAEPTMARAVTVHRGIATSIGIFKAKAGHASGGHALEKSSNHQAVRWANHALAFATQKELDGQSIRFNLGVIAGGTKPNMIASSTEVRFGTRPAAGVDGKKLLEEIWALTPATIEVDWRVSFLAPSLPLDLGGAIHQRAEQWVSELSLPVGDPVDFWTEAALFSAAQYPAIVFGAGNIAQAHTADEFVDICQLQSVYDVYKKLLANS